jgi:hypothetical protein
LMGASLDNGDIFRFGRFDIGITMKCASGLRNSL